jgi:hypothetical protein
MHVFLDVVFLLYVQREGAHIIWHPTVRRLEAEAGGVDQRNNGQIETAA